MAAHAQDGPWACTRQPRSRGGSEVHPWQAACPAVLPLTQPVAAPPPGRGWNAGREEAWKRTRTGPELVSMGLVCGLHPRVIRAVEGLGHSSPGEERIVPPVTFKCALAIPQQGRGQVSHLGNPLGGADGLKAGSRMLALAFPFARL